MSLFYLINNACSAMTTSLEDIFRILKFCSWLAITPWFIATRCCDCISLPLAIFDTHNKYYMRRENAFLQKPMWFVQTQWCPLGCNCTGGPTKDHQQLPCSLKFINLRCSCSPVLYKRLVCVCITPKTSNVHMLTCTQMKWREVQTWRTSCKLKVLSVQEDNHVVWPLMIITNASLLLWNSFPWTPGHPLPDSISQALKPLDCSQEWSVLCNDQFS